MAFEQLISSFPWETYPLKLKKRIVKPVSVGVFTDAAAKEAGLRFIEGDAGSFEEGNWVHVYFLVDPEDGMLVDGKFQAWGDAALIGVTDVIMDIAIRKNYDQAGRMTKEIFLKALEEKELPADLLEYFSLVMDAVKECTMNAMDIPLPTGYVAPPVPGEMPIEGEGYPGWKKLPMQEKLAVLNQVLDQDVRPYIEMDAGGVEVLSIEDDTKIMIAYQGACTTCFSATGATLSYIQQVLRAKIDKDVEVIPDLSIAP